MIPQDVRLYTWLDVEVVLLRSLEAEDWPSWFLDARAYWDGVHLRVKPGQLGASKRWIRDIFAPRIIEPEPDLFTQLWIALESARGSVRQLAISIEESTEPSPEIRVLPTFARPALLQHGTHVPLKPPPFKEGSPAIFAFHSFKGGVGRTVHALALAQALSESQGPALLVDADLEAPGITWLLESRFPAPVISFADLLALVHGDPNPLATNSIEIAAERLQDLTLGKLHVLPAFRSAKTFQSLDIRPEHLLQSRTDPFALSNLLAELGRSLGVNAIVIDLRAGMSELSAGLLLDPRIIRVFVTTLSGQSLNGTELVLNVIAQRAPSVSDTDPVPIVLMNQVPPEIKGTETLSVVEERLLTVISKTLPDKEIEAVEVLRGPSWFNTNLLTLATDWDQAMDLIRRSQIRESVQSLVDLAPLGALRAPAAITLSNVEELRRKLAATAGKLVFAEQGEGEDFLPISPLRRLIADHRNQLPVSVVVGAKGAGKTFTFLQVVRRPGWQDFVLAAGESRGNLDGLISPILQPTNVSGRGATILEHARKSVVTALATERSLSFAELQDEVRGWLAQELDESAWRERWLDLMAWGVGFKPKQAGAGRDLADFLKTRNKRLLLVFDGLEDLFQDLSSSTFEQRALRALLQDVPNWIDQEPDRVIGVLIFVRRDMVTAAVRQNTAQLLARYEPYALRWERLEALRLIAWVSLKAGLFQNLSNDRLREMDAEALTESLVTLWGRKLGVDRSREGRSSEWVIAALSDFRGQIQARDIVRLLHFAARKSERNATWSDRILAPGPIREAVADCSQEKVAEISQENPALKGIFERLQGLPAELKSVPFRREDVGLSQPDVQLLELNGILIAEGDAYYMPEIFRRGLAFRIPAGARPKVLALGRKNQR